MKLFANHNDIDANEIENNNKNDNYIKFREIPEISQIKIEEIKYNLIDDNYLEDLKNFIINFKYPINSPNSTVAIGALFPLEKLVEAGFNNDPDFSDEMINKYNLYLKYIFNYRTIKGDGNCYYRAVMFRYFEIIILNKEIELLRNIIFDMKNSFYSKEIMERKEIKLNTVFKPDLPLKIMFIILELITDNNIELAHLIFLKSLLICPIFDYGLIFYFRYIIYNYIRENEDKLYLKNFPIKIGNLLPSKYETEDGEFLFNSFYQNYLLKMFMDAEKIIIYLTPFILGMNLNIIVFNDDSEIIKNINYEGKPKYALKDKIFLMNRKNHYEIIYCKEDNEKYKSIFHKFINNDFLEESIILYEIKQKNNNENYIIINNNSNIQITGEKANLNNHKKIIKKKKIKKKLKKQPIQSLNIDTKNNSISNDISNDISNIPSEKGNNNYTFNNEELSLKSNYNTINFIKNDNNKIDLIIDNNEKEVQKDIKISSNILNDNNLAEKDNNLKVIKKIKKKIIKKKKKKIINSNNDINNQRTNQTFTISLNNKILENSKNIEIINTDIDNNKINKEKIQTDKNKIFSNFKKEYKCQICSKTFTLECEIKICLCYECFEKEIKNQFCDKYLSYIKDCLENEFENEEIIQKFNDLRNKIININQKNISIDNAINQIEKYNNKNITFNEIFINIIKETKQNICLICSRKIDKNEENIMKIPCGCIFCGEKHLKFYFEQKNPISREKEYICYCSYIYKIQDIYNLGIMFSRSLPLNKLRKKIIEYLNNKLQKQCCACISKDDIIMNNSIRYKDDKNTENNEILPNYKELRHYLCRNCSEKITNKEIFLCKICNKQHIFISRKLK